MSTKRIFDAGSVVALVALIAFGIFAVAGGLGGSEATTASDEAAREASCLAGSEDCDDTAGDALGVCAPGVTDCVDTAVGGGDGGDDVANACLAPEEGVEVDLEEPVDCVDTPGTGGGFEQICAADAPECNDACSVSSNGDVDCGSGGSDGFGGGSSSPGFPGCANDAECERVAVEAAWALLEEDGVSGEITFVSAKSVEWPNSCLGVTDADIACAEVITPGFIVLLERNGLEYTFNTDLAGNAVNASN
jgi:hypothetical protein